jgi:hypothetical protein
MKNNSMKKLLSLVLAFVLTAALALTGCSGKPAETTAPTEAPESAGSSAFTILGEGEKSFELIIVDKEGKEHLYLIHTDEEMVGFALIEHKLIEGEQGDYGLYVKKVNGITADYNVDQTYWAFYIGSDYGMTGVDMTNIEAGATYAFKVSK